MPVILHAFNWKYDAVSNLATRIADAGYASVLVSPVNKSTGPEWWARYQPQDYRVIHSPLGDKVSFQNMVAALDAVGVKVYVDVVLNHMANEHELRPGDLSYPGQRVLDEYAANPHYYNIQRLFGDIQNNFLNRFDFGSTQRIYDWLDVWQVQHWRLSSGGDDPGLPTLVENDWVVSQQQEYLRALKDMGVKGFRVHAAKHMTIEHLNRVLTPNIMSGLHVFGQVVVGGGLGNREYELFLAPYLAGTSHGAEDFPLFHTLQRAMGWGGSLTALANPEGGGHALDRFRAVTFAITHDIPNNPVFRGLVMDPIDEELAYVYLLGRDGGVPIVYSDHNETPQYNSRWVGGWEHPDKLAMIKFHNACQGLCMNVLAVSDYYMIFQRYNVGIVGINKSNELVQVPLNMRDSVLWWNTDYVDVLESGNTVHIKQECYTFNIPARSARMWLRKDVAEEFLRKS